MESKGLKIFLIAIIFMIIVGLIGFMALAITRGLDWSKNNHDILVRREEFSFEEIENLNFDIVSADITFYESADNKIIVEQYSDVELKSHELFTSELAKNTLSIKDGKSKNSFFIFSFGFTGWSYKVYIPSDYRGNLDVKSISGEVDVTYPIVGMNNVKIDLTSGDFNATRIDGAGSFEIKTISGEIDFEHIKAYSVSMKTTSGDINGQYLGSYNNQEGKVNIDSVSGEVEIDTVTGILECETTSGDIIINKYEIEGNTKIKSISGEVIIGISSGTGYEIKTKTISGDVRLPDNYYVNKDLPYHIFQVETISGDIIINQK